MRKKNIRFLFWLPRLLAVAYILFLAIFALDVFVPGRSFVQTAVALGMHLLPNFLLILILFVAWKREVIGGVLFLLAGIFFTVFFNTSAQTASFLAVSLPALLIGVLFVLTGKIKR